MPKRKQVAVLVFVVSGIWLAACGTTNATGSPQVSITSSPVNSAKGTQTIVSSSTGSSIGAGKSAIVASGTDRQDPENEWVLGSSGLAITRDGGRKWAKVTLPLADVNDVAVLPSETIVLAGNGSQSLSIDTLISGQNAWTNRVIPLAASQQIGSSEIVDANGIPIGVMVTLQSSSQFSHGLWIATPDGGKTWQSHEAPVGGTVTSTSGDLWLVGGVINSLIFQSSNNGATWNAVTLPLQQPTGQTYALAPVYSAETGDSAVLTATVASSSGSNYSSVVILTGHQSGSQWTWKSVTTIKLKGSYGGGAGPATAYSNGTFWILSPDQVARVNISTSQVSIVSPDGLPAATTLILSALNSQTAWISYSVVSCAATKRDCASTTGLSATIDGGEVWSPYPNPLA